MKEYIYIVLSQWSKIISEIYLLCDYDVNLIYNDFVFVILSVIFVDIIKFEIITNLNNTRQDKNGK